MNQIDPICQLKTSFLQSRKLIFFVYPDPEGSEENQFTPLGDGVNKLIFEAVKCLLEATNWASLFVILDETPKLGVSTVYW
jgi:hypothetical protein